MKKSLLFVFLCLSVSISPAQFRRAVFWRHSVGLCFWDRSQLSNLTPPTTITKEVSAYNSAHGYTGSSAVSMTESYFPGPEGVVNDNNWYRWDLVFNGRDSYGQTVDYSTPVIVVKTCYLSQQGMKSIDSIEAYKAHIRHIVSVMKNHPNNFFVIWTNYPAATDGHADRAAWSNTFSIWMKQTLATGNDSFGPFPPNVYVFDVFHKLASAVDGYCDPIYGSGSEGPGDDHPSNAAVAIVDPVFIQETFDAAIAYERRFAPAASALPASNITTTGLQLNGSVNPNGYSTTSRFEFGTTTAYGTSTSVQNLGAGTSAVSVNAPLSGLTAGTLYHWRLIASSSMGTTYTSDSTVTTIPAVLTAPTATTLTAGSITTTGAQLNGSVNPNGSNTDYHFEYGLTPDYGSSTLSANAGAGYSASAVNAAVASLAPGTVYHFRIVATNSLGTTYGGDSTFKTLTPPPAAVTLSASGITPTGVQFNGSVNPNGFSTSYYFQYGTSKSYGSSTTTGDAGAGTSPIAVLAAASGLAPGVLYHYRIVATSEGGTSYGIDSTFTTAVPPPTVSTAPATSVGLTGAQLNGSINPNGFSTSYHFEYGTTGTYGSSTSSASAGSGMLAVIVSAPVSGLVPGTIYHYRVVASNSGGTVYGDDFTLTTAILPPAVLTLKTSAITPTGAQVSGQVNPNGLSTDYHFEYGLNTTYGSSSPTVNAGSGINTVAVNALLTGLTPGTAYHYRLVATNVGGTTYGIDSSFVTAVPAPSAATLGATGITSTGAQFNGAVNPNGFATDFHFEYGATTTYGSLTPNIDGGAGQDQIAASAAVTSLSPGRVYHYRVVAHSAGGTAYGNDTMFTTVTPPPTVVTTTASSITTTGAQFNGSVNPNGFSTSYHFEYGTSGSYGSSTSPANAGAGTSMVPVSAAVNSLVPGTLYHYRLVASNSGGTVYGNDSTLTTTILPPTVTTLQASALTTTGAEINGQVNPNGLSTDYHFEYGLSTGYGSSSPTVNAGSGINTVSVNAPLTGLTPGTTYHYRIVATSGGGTTYGSDSSFVTGVPLPSAVTLSATSFTTTGAQLNGSVNPNGFATDYHFDYGTTTGYGSSTSVTNAGTGTGQISASAAVTTLTPGTVYHYRLVAHSAGGTAYGFDSTFTTVTPPPLVVTSAASNITTAGAQLNGQVNPNRFTTSYHFEYGLTKTYSGVTSSQNAGAGATAVPVSSPVSSLTPGSLYHYRLVATNIGGTAYGNDTTFTTLIPPPTAVTLAAGGISTTGAQLNGTVNPNGFGSNYHFEYGTTTGYGSSTATVDAGSGSSPVGASAVVSSLSPGHTYHYRLVATNSGGTSYGSDATFTTATPPPVVTTSAATSISTVSAQLNGTVNPNGFATSYSFQYGLTSSYGMSTSNRSAGSGSSAVPASASVSSLSPGTMYHYRLVATNGGGTTYGSDATFTTAIPPPTATTTAATSITTTAAQINGTVNPNGFSTTLYFEYGTTAGYGSTTSSQSAGSGSGTSTVNASLGGLTPGTLYHYRIVATNSGGTAYGIDSTFTTINYSVVSIIAFLQGPSLGASMSTALDSKGILAGHFHAIPIPGIAVDSINIEIRDSLQGAKSTLRRFAPAWLIADGSIRDFFDTTKSSVGFTGVPAGNYFVVVRHRNHLAVMSSGTVTLSASPPLAAYDFSTAQSQAYGSNAMTLAGTHYALISGNANNADNVINALDRVATRNNLGANDYNNADVNLDGVVNALDRVVARNDLGQSSQVP